MDSSKQTTHHCIDHSMERRTTHHCHSEGHHTCQQHMSRISRPRSRVFSRHKCRSIRLLDLLVFLSVIIPSVLSEQFTVTSTTTETTTFEFTTTTAFETTTTEIPTTTGSPSDFTCDCVQCVGETLPDCDPAYDSANDYLSPIECPRNENCSVIEVIDKFGFPMAVVRKCIADCVEQQAVNCSAVEPDIYMSSRLTVVPSDLEGGTCRISSCECVAFQESDCSPNPEGTVTTSDGPSCPVCTGETRTQCDNNMLITPCSQSDAVCLETYVYSGGGVTTSVSISCASYATVKARIQTQEEFNTCSSSATARTCYMSSPASFCADSPQMCPSSESTGFCEECTGVSLADCNANTTPVNCNDLEATCLLIQETDPRGSAGQVSRSCQTLSYCQQNNLPINEPVQVNTSTTEGTYTCERPICADISESCTYLACPVCDVTDLFDAEALCDQEAVVTACTSAHTYCRANATIDDRGTIITFSRGCAEANLCPDSTYFVDNILDNCQGTSCAMCSVTSCTNTTDAPPVEVTTTPPTQPPNPCDSNPCYGNATCVSSEEVNEYICQCPYGYSGMDCNIPDTTVLFPFGTEVGDASFLNTDDESVDVQFPQPFNYLGNDFDTYHINTNGYITLGRDFQSFTPVAMPPNTAKPDLAMIAPLWMDFTTVGSTGEDTGIIYYQTYEKLCKNSYLGEDLRELYDTFDSEVVQTGDTSFQANMITIVTWVNMSYYGSPGERATFQLALGMDYARYRSYAIFLYKEITTADATRPNREGYTSATNTNYNPSRTYAELSTSATTSFILLPRIEAESLGRHVFLISTNGELTQDSPESKCWEWNCQEAALQLAIDLYDSILPICPCIFEQTQFDSAFSFDATTGCAITVDPALIWARKCCYLADAAAPLGYDALNTAETYAAGSVFRYHPDYYTYNYNLFDRDPKDWCCLESNNCNFYYDVRPADNCFGYVPPQITVGVGDPHITTIDGKLYTYQGLGEYWLLKSDLVQIQGRTTRANDASGNPISATVWSALAFKDSYSSSVEQDDNSTVSASRVQVGIITTGTTQELDIYIQESALSLTAWFRDAALGEFRTENRILFKKNSNRLTIILPSSISIDAEVGVDQLVFTITYPLHRLLEVSANARGLLGTPNGIQSDDFTDQDGNQIDINSDCATIRDSFGDKWKITKLESLFYYSGADTFDSHEAPPGYLGDCTDPDTYVFPDPGDAQRANDTCGADRECRIDFILTGDQALAAATAEVITQKAAEQALLDTQYSIIDGPMTLTVQVGKEATLTVTANSTSGLTTTITTNFTLPAGASFDAATGVFRWTPPDHSAQPFDMIFGGVDSMGNMAVPLAVTVTFCNCTQDKGSCPDDGTPVKDPNHMFQVQTCMCEVYYSGPTCEEDYDFCELDALCPITTTCVDTPLNEHILNGGPGYMCTGCPDGYDLVIQANNRTKCIDIDECDVASNNNCSQVCVNEVGGFSCACFPGYMPISSTDCQETDECALGTDLCEQECTNTPDGSYTCTCVNGFDLVNETLCEPDATTITNCMGFSCTYECADPYNNGSYGCICQSGYELDADERTCNDIDECTAPNNHQCGANSDCTNTDGSYFCICRDGYTLNSDERTCSACAPLMWGPNCANICQRCESVASCNNVAGCTQCTVGYDGATCTNIDECALDMDDCNRTISQCHDLDGAYSCLCFDGYESTTTGCAEIDDCDQTFNGEPLCGDGGSCTDLHLDYRCTCATGYTGRNCEINMDDCTPNPCQNGGMCHDLVDSYTCTCAENYYGANCQHLLCQNGTNMNPTSLMYNGSMTLNEMYDQDLEDETSAFYIDLVNAIATSLQTIYSCLTQETVAVYKDIISIEFAENNTLIQTTWTLVLSDYVNPRVLEDAIRNHLLEFQPINVSAPSVIYYGPEVPPDDSLNTLAIVLGTVGGILFICMFVVCILCVLWRVRRRDRGAATTDSDTSSEREEPYKPGFVGPRFGRLHWQDLPSMHASSIPPSTEPTEDDDVYIPRIPRPRVVQRPQTTVPNIDWSVLRNFSNRFGYGAGMPDSTMSVGEEPQQAPPIHRGTPPYRKKGPGQFFWVPTESDQ